MSHELDPQVEQDLDLRRQIEESYHEGASGFLVAVFFDCDGELAHCFGPFDQPEQALGEMQRIDNMWQAQQTPEDPDWLYRVVALFPPSCDLL